MGILVDSSGSLRIGSMSAYSIGGAQRLFVRSCRQQNSCRCPNLKGPSVRSRLNYRVFQSFFSQFYKTIDDRYKSNKYINQIISIKYRYYIIYVSKSLVVVVIILDDRLPRSIGWVVNTVISFPDLVDSLMRNHSTLPYGYGGNGVRTQYECIGASLKVYPSFPVQSGHLARKWWFFDQAGNILYSERPRDPDQKQGRSHKPHRLEAARSSRGPA